MNTLYLPNNPPIRVKEIFDSLIESGEFRIEQLEFDYPKIGRSHKWFCVFKVNEHLIAYDMFDNYKSMKTFGKIGYFDNGGPLSDVKLMIVVQYNPITTDYFERFTNAHGIPCDSWTMFDKLYSPGYNELDKGVITYDLNKQHKYIGAFFGAESGRVASKIRLQYVEEMKKTEGFFAMSSPTDGIISDQKILYDLWNESKWGIIIKGKGFEAKNSREVLLSSYGMPLALTYQPHYPFEGIKPNEDYVFLETPEDLHKLKHIDPTPYAKKSKEFYENYFSPKGRARNLMRLIKKHIEK